MTALEEIIGDLHDEHAALAGVVTGLDPGDWLTPTPATDWSVRDQISHLVYFDNTARMALADPAAFGAHKAELMSGDLGREPDVELGRSQIDHGIPLQATWAIGTVELVSTARARAESDPITRVAWYGPDMSLASFLTARLMETWAHGQDVRDALGAPAVVSDRLRHVCHIGTGARHYAFLVHGVDDPGTPVRVEATAPNGEIWTFGPGEADETISGSALGLALVFTQRRHPDDTDVTATGAAAAAWLGVAQAFAGPPGPGREAGLGFPETSES